MQLPRGVRIPIRNFAGPLVLGLILGLSASAEELRYPVDVAVGPGGEIYVADIEAAALLRWNGAGFEVVAQGEGLPRTPLFGIRHIVPESDGTVLASDPATMALYRITAAGEITAIPDDAGFVTPWGIAVDSSGRILAVDRVTQRLRRVGSDSIEDLATIRAPRAILAGSDGSLHVLTDRNVLRIEDGDGHPLVQSPPFEFPHDFVRAPDGGFLRDRRLRPLHLEGQPGGPGLGTRQGRTAHKSPGHRARRRRRSAGCRRPRADHLSNLRSRTGSPAGRVTPKHYRRKGMQHV